MVAPVPIMCWRQTCWGLRTTEEPRVPYEHERDRDCKEKSGMPFDHVRRHFLLYNELSEDEGGNNRVVYDKASRNYSIVHALCLRYPHLSPI